MSAKFFALDDTMIAKRVENRWHFLFSCLFPRIPTATMKALQAEVRLPVSIAAFRTAPPSSSRMRSFFFISVLPGWLCVRVNVQERMLFALTCA
jgi:hypothetical protein